MQLAELTERLDDRLRTAAYGDIDASPNGLQVGPSADGLRVSGDRATEVSEEATEPAQRATREIERAAFAVDAAQATMETAHERDADLLVTHHGLIWGGLDRVTGREYDRIRKLIERDLALYVSHLPLDGHPELGNAARLADALGIDETDPFADAGGEWIGRRGRLPESTTPAALSDRLDDVLPAGDRPVRSFTFGPDRIERVAIATGSAADWLGEAADAGVDAFVTGEGKQKLYHEAREAGLNVFLGGHYRTEVGGVRALAELVSDWGVETTVIDHPTGL